MSNQEQIMLSSGNVDPQSNSRLACCIPIESWMNGMKLSMDPVANDGEERDIF